MVLAWFKCLDLWKGGGSEYSGWNGVNSDISYGIGLLVAKFTEFNTCCYLSNNFGSSGISIGEGGFSIGEGGDSGIGRDWIGMMMVTSEGKVIVMVV